THHLHLFPVVRQLIEWHLLQIVVGKQRYMARLVLEIEAAQVLMEGAEHRKVRVLFAQNLLSCLCRDRQIPPSTTPRHRPRDRRWRRAQLDLLGPDEIVESGL